MVLVSTREATSGGMDASALLYAIQFSIMEVYSVEIRELLQVLL